MSLKDLIQSEIKVNNIKIKVISKHDGNLIVGDASTLAICQSSKSEYMNMIEGQCYIILKPIKQDLNFFIPNEKFKPIKINTFLLVPKRIEINKLMSLIETKPPMKNSREEKSDNQFLTFEDLKKLAGKSEVKAITAKVISISKDIKGCYGTYNIGKLKDIRNEKMDINLYKRQVRYNINVGDIVELKQLKISEYTKDGENVKRLATTLRSTGGKCNIDVETLFKDVPLGDEKQEGTVVAVTDIFHYLSCSKCWKKTAEYDKICQCENIENIHVNDFHCQFYIEMVGDNEIKVVHTFRRTTNLDIDSGNPDDIQKTLEATFLNKPFIFEWNISSDEELTMVFIKEILRAHKQDNKEI